MVGGEAVAVVVLVDHEGVVVVVTVTAMDPNPMATPLHQG